MAKPNFPEKQTISTTTTWGTWEELLLACAVHRYGADSWDSVSSELRKRTSTLHLLTPHSCKQKYHDLRRRFTQNAVVSSAAADGAATANAAVASIPFLDELRRLRVAELRREVERYDLSIVSLESKVEKLKEEREQSLKETDERAEKADLEKEDGETKPENWSPENIAEKAVSGEGSVHDERSVDESNSTNLKDDAPETGGAAAEKEPERARECGKPAVEDSYDGSSETIAKGSAAVSPVEESEKVNSEKDGGGESAESKGGEEGAKEVCSSEMQSSTSLSRKKVEEPDEPDAEDQSVATKRAHHVESKSLADFLEILRSHRSGSFFERRLEIQDTTNYINMIRQHIDFEMVRIRLEEGWYSGCKSKFFRDVLLILNNAIVFFGRRSPESKAALELRLLVLKEMAQRSAKQDSLPKEEAQAPKPEPEETDMLLRKPKLSVPMNACRKRSSITARAASTSSSGPERKKEQTQTSALLDVKPAMSWKQSDKSSDKAEELPSTKKRRKERLRAGAKNNSSNKSSVSRSNAENNKNSGANSNASPSTKGGTSNEISISKSDKKNNNSNASGKKQSAANFLNRMKRGSSSSNRSLPETLKDSDKSSRGGAEQKKSGGNKGNSKQKEQTSTRKASGGKQAKEHESPSKRSVGRPSKRAAAAAVPAKRSRQSIETEVTAARNAKKRRK